MNISTTLVPSNTKTTVLNHTNHDFMHFTTAINVFCPNLQFFVQVLLDPQPKHKLRPHRPQGEFSRPRDRLFFLIVKPLYNISVGIPIFLQVEIPNQTRIGSEKWLVLGGHKFILAPACSPRDNTSFQICSSIKQFWKGLFYAQFTLLQKKVLKIFSFVCFSKRKGQKKLEFLYFSLISLW